MTDPERAELLAEIERLQDRLWKAAQEIQGYKDAFAQATEQPE